MENAFLAAVKQRRTIYGIGKEVTISDERLQEIVEEAITHTPSAFNSQSARVVLLLGEQHDKLWAMVKEELRKIVPAAAFALTEEKINNFAKGYGSVLFFEDRAVVEKLQEQFPTYRDKFPQWSDNSSGMLQFVVWTALETEGLGASLQHYNPVIDGAVKESWDIPASWKLIAQMPFGQPTAAPGPKEFLPLEQRLRVHK